MSPVNMANTLYTVPMIASDLRHEEMIQQMCDTLTYLDQVASDIFSRISQRVAENREKLVQLNGRIAVAEAKVNRIKGQFSLAFVLVQLQAPCSVYVLFIVVTVKCR